MKNRISMEQSKGYIEVNAVFILFFLSSVLIASSSYVIANIRYIENNKKDFREHNEIVPLLKEMLSGMQELKLYDYDWKENAVLTDLRSKYRSYNLEIADCSSGFHPDFFSYSDLENPVIKDSFFINNDSAQFIERVKKNGLIRNDGELAAYIKQDMRKFCTSYGWLHTKLIGSPAYEAISKSHNQYDKEKLFPLVNDFPLMNINMIDPVLINIIMDKSKSGIRNFNEKKMLLERRLASGPVALPDISSIMEIPYTHDLFVYFGTKTAFWKLTFITPPGLRVEALVAAIPEKNAPLQQVSEYKLLHWRIADAH